MRIGKLISKKNRALLRELVATDFKLRYQGSILGYAWSLLRPLLLFMILYVVFVKIIRLGNNVPHYPVYLLFGIVMWNFFAEMTSQSLGSIVGRGDLIRKVRIPRWIIVISSSVSALINLVLNLFVVAVFMLINHVGLMSSAFWLPLILLQIYIFALGVSFFLAAAFVKFRDMSYIWEVIMQAMFYLTPIVYAMTAIHNVLLEKLIFLNPMAQAIQDARYVSITRETLTIRNVYSGWMTLVPIGITIFALFGGTFYFRARAKYFAEEI